MCQSPQSCSDVMRSHSAHGLSDASTPCGSSQLRFGCISGEPSSAAVHQSTFARQSTSNSLHKDVMQLSGPSSLYMSTEADTGRYLQHLLRTKVAYVPNWLALELSRHMQDTLVHTSRTMRMRILSRRVPIMTVSRVQGHRSNDTAILQADPCIELMISQHALGD